MCESVPALLALRVAMRAARQRNKGRRGLRFEKGHAPHGVCGADEAERISTAERNQQRNNTNDAQQA